MQTTVKYVTSSTCISSFPSWFRNHTKKTLSCSESRILTRWYHGVKVSEEQKTNANGDLLILSSTFAWPESDASAAGVRTEALFKYFQYSDHDLFDNVFYGTGRKPPDSVNHMNELSIHYFPLNQGQKLKELLTENSKFANLKAVIFDRYYTEEAYSFHFYRHRPEIVRILDMQDVHSLRQMRQDIVYQHDQTHGIINSYIDNIKGKCRMTFPLMKQLMTCIPEVSTASLGENKENSLGNKNKKSYDKFIRELTAIHRSDLTLVCSPAEMRLLKEQFKIQPHKLALAPFFVSRLDQRSDYHHPRIKKENSNEVEFVMLGGFLHEPNVDSVRYVNYELWPHIYQQISRDFQNVSIHIYGAHLSNKLRHQLVHRNQNKNFYLHGKADTLDQVFGPKDQISQNRKILLAPLRFGAGIKGKIIEAWKHGCPVITTPIGAEGMTSLDNIDLLSMSENCQKSKEIDDIGWGGLIASDTDSLVQCAVKLYEDEDLWEQCRLNGHHLLQSLYDDKTHFNEIKRSIQEAMRDMNNRRRHDYTYGMLWHQSFRSTEYFSKWIEVKERKKADELEKIS